MRREKIEKQAWDMTVETQGFWRVGILVEICTEFVLFPSTGGRRLSKFRFDVSTKWILLYGTQGLPTVRT